MSRNHVLEVMKILPAALILAGCATPAQVQQARAAETRAMQELEAAAVAAVVACRGKEQCDTMFDLAKSYVHSNSDMKVQISDSVSISTYNPVKSGYVGMTASRMPVAGGSIISLSVSCNGLGSPYFSGDCVNKMIPIYKGFPHYLNLAQAMQPAPVLDSTPAGRVEAARTPVPVPLNGEPDKYADQGWRCKEGFVQAGKECRKEGK